MPELPEVETIVRGLRPALTGRVIRRLLCRNPRTLDCGGGFRPRDICGHAIVEVSRRGKYVCVRLENGLLFTLHLRMTGKLLLELPRSERPYERLRLTFDDGRHLHFIDTRRFGRLKIWPVAAIPGLGPEPLSFRTVQRILSGLQTRRPIKSVLLDQSVLAGIGNIYADEALHLAGIDPALPASALGPAALARLGRSIPRILNQAIRRQGTTLADYRTPANRRGRNQEHLRVYGREGQPCFVCGEGVQRRRIGGRSSYRCPRCQAGER